MNMRITAIENLLSSDTPKIKLLLEDLEGFVCFIPSVIVGESMTIMYRNAISVRHRTAAVVSWKRDKETGVYTITTEDCIFIMLDLEHGRHGKPKRIASTLYMESRIRHNPLRVEYDPDGHLFSDGIYPTKIFASDLPEHFVFGYMYKRHGFISAAGVKHLLYVPNYTFNHLYKYDNLFISYDEPIQPEKKSDGFQWYEGYKHVVSGLMITHFIDAVERYSKYPVSAIRDELEKKRVWYYEKYGDNGEYSITTE